jgi:hypothetical protein
MMLNLSRTTRLTLLSVLIGLFATQALAADVSFEFTATVTDVNANLTSMAGLVGQTGTGRVTYDSAPATSAYYTNSQIYGYEAPPASFEFTLDGNTYVAGAEAHTTVSAIDADVQVEVGNDRMTWPQVPLSDRIRYWGLWTGQTIDSYPFKMEIILNDQTSSLFNDTTLPTACPDLADFDGYPTTQFVIMIEYADQSSTSGITCRVDTITCLSEPEPHSLTLSLPTSVDEGDGVLSDQGQIAVSPVPDADLTVTLVSSDVTEIAVPSSITVLAGNATAVFDLTVIDDTEDDGLRYATVTAASDVYGSASQTVAVTDDDDPPADDGGDDGGGDSGGDDGDASDVLDVSGSWNVTEVADESDCGQGINTKHYTVTIAQTGTTFTVQTPYGTLRGSLNGSVGTWSGRGSEDGGTLQTSGSVTFSEDGNGYGVSYSAIETWTWDDGAFYCSGTSELSGSRGNAADGNGNGNGDSGGGGGGGGCLISTVLRSLF